MPWVGRVEPANHAVLSALIVRPFARPDVEDDMGAQPRGPHAEPNQLATDEVLLVWRRMTDPLTEAWDGSG